MYSRTHHWMCRDGWFRFSRLRCFILRQCCVLCSHISPALRMRCKMSNKMMMGSLWTRITRRWWTWIHCVVPLILCLIKWKIKLIVKFQVVLLKRTQRTNLNLSKTSPCTIQKKVIKLGDQLFHPSVYLTNAHN